MGSHTQVDVFPLLRNCGRDRDLGASSRYTAKWFPYVPKTKKTYILSWTFTKCSLSTYRLLNGGWIRLDYPWSRHPDSSMQTTSPPEGYVILHQEMAKLQVFGILWAFHWTLSAVLTIFVIFCHCRGHDNWSHCLATNTSCCVLRQNDPVCSGQNGPRTFLKGWNVVSVCPQGAGWSPHACKEWKGETHSPHCFSLGANVMAN